MLFARLLGVEDLARKLSEHVLFQTSTSDFIESLAAAFKPSIFKPSDEPIIRVGEVGLSMYFIYKGVLNILDPLLRYFITVMI